MLLAKKKFQIQEKMNRMKVQVVKHLPLPMAKIASALIHFAHFVQ
jgi:hypothetical protein